jgi:hypothetical protein
VNQADRTPDIVRALLEVFHQVVKHPQAANILYLLDVVQVPPSRGAAGPSTFIVMPEGGLTAIASLCTSLMRPNSKVTKTTFTKGQKNVLQPYMW